MKKPDFSGRPNLTELAEAVGGDFSRIYRCLPQDKSLKLAHAGNAEKFPRLLSTQDGVVAEIFSHPRPISHEKQSFGPAFSGFPSKFLACAPLKIDQKILGLLILGKSAPFSTGQMELIGSYAFQVSLWEAIDALENDRQKLAKKLSGSEKKLGTAYRRVLESDKIANIGHLAAGISHELNTPLGAIQTYAEYLQLFVKGETEQDSLSGIVKAVRHCKEIVDNVLRLSREVKNEFSPVRMEAVIADAIQITDPEMGKNGIRVEYRAESSPEVEGNHSRLVQIITNLLTNAKDSIVRPRLIKRNGQIAVHLGQDETDAVIEISDNGCGIPKKIQGKIFDPFFTTKEIGQGIGLGLSICHSILEEHRGRVDVQSEQGRGTKMSVRIPLFPRGDGHV